MPQRRLLWCRPTTSAGAPEHGRTDVWIGSPAAGRESCGRTLLVEGWAERAWGLDVAVAPRNSARAAARRGAIVGARKHGRARSNAPLWSACARFRGVHATVVRVRGRGRGRGRLGAARAVVGVRGFWSAIVGREVWLGLHGHGCAFAMVSVVPPHVGVDTEATGASREGAFER